MSKTWIIAKHEFIVTVSRKGYLLVLFGMPLLFGGIIGVSLVSQESLENAVSNSAPTGVIDQSGLIDFSLGRGLDTEAAQKTPDPNLLAKPLRGKNSKIISYTEPDEALRDLKNGRLSVVYLMEKDYLKTGKIACYVAEKGIFSDLTPIDRGRLYTLIRASLIKNQMDPQIARRVLAPGMIRQVKVSKNGLEKASNESFKEMAEFFGPFSMFLLLTMSIFFSSGYLLQGIAEEKQNRVIEVILSSVRPTELLVGKIMGLGAAGLLQVFFYVGLLFLPAITVFALFHVSVSNLLLSVVYFLLGYLLFAGLMAGTGILGNSPQESAQLSAIWTLASVIPMFLLAPISESPNSWLARGLSFFPLTAPVTMLLRVSAAEVPTLDIVISIVVLILGIAAAIRGSAKIFRAAALMYGKRPSLGEIIRWLREA
jgi:ABC-2 type transport system permease protein